MALIERLEDAERLYLLGDLVNRGPDSLGVLRWAVAQGERVRAVLGNHDLHLLHQAWSGKAKGALKAVLEAPDREALLEWLRQQPLLREVEGYVLVHAGLLPEWTVPRAAELARELEGCLQGPDGPRLLRTWRARERTFGADPLLDALDGFTRLRVVQDADGRPDYCYKGPPQEAPSGLIPWFAAAERESAGSPIVFGHWAALGLHLGADAIGLDSGCVWGKQLTALRLADRRVVQVDSCHAPGH